MIGSIRAAWQRRAVRRSCFHHDHSGGGSWMVNELIDLGRRKMWWCTRCQRTWIK